MRIVISEFMDERAVAQLRARHDVLYDPTLVDDVPRLQQQAANCDALIVRNRTQVAGELLAALKTCRVVGRLGVGLDSIDVAGCEAKGIQVIPAAGANALSVAEYVIATAMMLLRGAYRSTSELAAGQWPRHTLANGRELAGKTLGVVGFGSIGQLTATLASALGMRTIASDAMLAPDHPAYTQLGARPGPLGNLVSQSDVITLHVRLTDATRNLFDAERIAAMKKGAILINTAGGGIVDEVAVAAALKSGHLGGAALDVFAQEPLPAAPHFDACPNLILTPHIAGISMESNERVSTYIAERVIEALR
jgi:(S)-sulfolactate dehydrogenase